AGMQPKAAEDLKRLMTNALVESGLTYAGAASFATPRRLTLHVEGLLAESPTTREERRGPKVGAPDKAIEGFCRGAGVSRDALEVRDDKKGQVYFATVTTPGRPAAEIIAEHLETTIRQFPWPKSMRWGAGSLRWVRPLQRILCILTDEGGHNVVPLTVDGFMAGDMTEGHRFMAPGTFPVISFDDYEAKLKRSRVVLRREEREEAIWNDATNAAFALGLEVVEDRKLLSEVAGLVEWPVVLMGAIDDDFLGLPPEVLQTSMKEHQKFFSVRNPKTGRIERFVTVANRETADNGATILAGNQKVLSARLADAKFFWENDLRVAEGEKMEPWIARLSDVTFHAKLGSLADRVARTEALARELAPVVGADPDLAAQAARVAKADLVSEMVYEFPELQGTMGRYYAQAAEMPPEVATACEAHYAPLGPSDDVPTEPVSIAVSLAEKLDLLTGFWAIDEKPTGSKDPFALRRAALGVMRTVLENDLRISLYEMVLGARAGLLRQALRSFRLLIGVIDVNAEKVDTFSGETNTPYRLATPADEVAAVSNEWRHGVAVVGRNAVGRTVYERELGEVPLRVADDLLSFFHDRLKVYLRDKGIRHDVIDACIAMPGNDDLVLLVKRAEALQTFMATEDGENLVQGFKRANNILIQAEEKDGVEYSFGADRKFADDPTEEALFDALDRADATIKPAMEAEDFAKAMEAMAALRAPIDAFFEAVQINTDAQAVRRNRLNLLHRIRQTCLQVADLTRLEG
ncbi:MAG: glycine--tRNA ligase subunit beta, partial [Shimia sp.]